MNRPAIVPAPLHATLDDGAPLVLDASSTLTAGDARAHAVAAALAGRLDLRQAPDAAARATVVLHLTEDRTLLGLTDDVDDARADGAYRLEVTEHGATLTARTPAGLAHAGAALGQVAEPGPDGSRTVAAMTVVDVPRFGWRGLSLDVARHFFDVAAVAQVVEVMADLRLNVLHLHLTDDQGWRVEVPSRPRLTEVAGRTAVDGGPGGWYSVADLARLVEHAAARGIAVVPEIDLPGHVNAALHAYGELTPSGTAPPAYTGIEVGFSRLHADLPTTEPFLADVLRDVAAQTPGPWVHIGGDEVHTMERTEYARLVEAAAAQVLAAGKQVVAWQEAAHADLPPGTVLQLWDHQQDPAPLVEAARRGARVLMSPAPRTYLDMKPDADSPLGLEWAGLVTLRDAYGWDPLTVVPDLPTQAVVGVEAAIWSETLRTVDDVVWMLLPRLAAVAEVAWSAPGLRDWTDFRTRLAAVAQGWSHLTWNTALLDGSAPAPPP